MTITAQQKSPTQPTADRDGKLAGTHLEDWQEVAGGWMATIVGRPGVHTSTDFAAAAPQIASAYRVRTSMVTIVPDPQDESRAVVLVQRTSPIRGVQAWAGPDSVDSQTGQAAVARYADGSTAKFELFRDGWGCPQVAAFGTSGSGKSEFLSLLFTVGRWAYRTLPDGTRTGMVADFLIDPQHGQSYAPFLDELAAPVASSIEEAIMLMMALQNEMERRNRYLARDAKWWDERRGRWRTGRKWWDPRIDGPILAVTIDEGHAYLSDRRFADLVAKASRMWRKCGGQIRIGTHTPLLTDLGGSTALRDMLTGGFVWVGRVANNLTGALAFNGRISGDPRSLPVDPGYAYILSALDPRGMIARTMWEPDWYDHLRDTDDQRIGYPAILPPETLAAFGPAYQHWVDWTARDDGVRWLPELLTAAAAGDLSQKAPPTKCVDAVRDVLAGAARDGSAPPDMTAIDTALREAGHSYSTRTVRDALAKLRDMDPPQVESTGPRTDQRHALTEAGLVAADGRDDDAPTI